MPVIPDYSTDAQSTTPATGARQALFLLLAINLLNFLDRYVLAAVEPDIQKQFFPGNPPNAEAWMGALATAFMVSYMVTAPIFGYLADRLNRWVIVAISVLLWSVATGASGVAGVVGGFVLLLITRLFVGVGEAGYGPAAPTLISDYYPIARRGAVLAWFYMAIPVGSAFGYIVGGQIAHHFRWQYAFYAVVAPGLLLGVLAFFFRDPRQRASSAVGAVQPYKATRADYLLLFRNRSYVLDCAGMTAMTFAIGGISFWMPKVLSEKTGAPDLGRINTIFGIITVVAGLTATLLGGWVGDLLRKKFPSSYFLVSGIAMLIACPFTLLILPTPFPYTWILIFLSIFFLFFNTGPSNTILANVTHPSVRSTAFALNIFIIHALGDATSPPILGKIGHYSWNAAFIAVTVVMALAGLLWLWGCVYLEEDTAMAPTRIAGAGPRGFPVVTEEPQKPV